jgi:hypothetical protein
MQVLCRACVRPRTPAGRTHHSRSSRLGDPDHRTLLGHSNRSCSPHHTPGMRALSLERLRRKPGTSQVRTSGSVSFVALLVLCNRCGFTMAATSLGEFQGASPPLREAGLRYSWEYSNRNSHQRANAIERACWQKPSELTAAPGRVVARLLRPTQNQLSP